MGEGFSLLSKNVEKFGDLHRDVIYMHKSCKRRFPEGSVVEVTLMSKDGKKVVERDIAKVKRVYCTVKLSDVMASSEILVHPVNVFDLASDILPNVQDKDEWLNLKNSELIEKFALDWKVKFGIRMYATPDTSKFAWNNQPQNVPLVVEICKCSDNLTKTKFLKLVHLYIKNNPDEMLYVNKSYTYAGIRFRIVSYFLTPKVSSLKKNDRLVDTMNFLEAPLSFFKNTSLAKEEKDEGQEEDEKVIEDQREALKSAYLYKLFGMIDTDGDDQLDYEEIKVWLQLEKLTDVYKSKHEQTMKQLDVDGDGIVSIFEFLKYFKDWTLPQIEQVSDRFYVKKEKQNILKYYAPKVDFKLVYWFDGNQTKSVAKKAFFRIDESFKTLVGDFPLIKIQATDEETRKLYKVENKKKMQVAFACTKKGDPKKVLIFAHGKFSVYNHSIQTFSSEPIQIGLKKVITSLENFIDTWRVKYCPIRMKYNV